MPVVERESNAVEAQALEERGIFILEEVFEELDRTQYKVPLINMRTHLIEEQFTLFLAHNIRKSSTDLEFTSRVSWNDVQPRRYCCHARNLCTHR